MNMIRNQFHSIEQAANQYLSNDGQVKKTDTKVSVNEISFSEVLKQKQFDTQDIAGGKLIFSKHANQRLESRNISLDEEQITRLNKGYEQAKEKSIKESLVMMDDIAFIVNIKNATVVTALAGENKESNVFTNIDGAVIV